MAGNLISASKLCVRHGICDMTLWRRINNAELRHPRPIYICGRRFFREEEIEAWERAQAVMGQRPPQRGVGVHASMRKWPPRARREGGAENDDPPPPMAA